MLKIFHLSKREKLNSLIIIKLNRIKESNEYIFGIYNSKFNLPKLSKIQKDVFVKPPNNLSTFSIQKISYEILEFGW